MRTCTGTANNKIDPHGNPQPCRNPPTFSIEVHGISCLKADLCDTHFQLFERHMRNSPLRWIAHPIPEDQI